MMNGKLVMSLMSIITPLKGLYGVIAGYHRALPYVDRLRPFRTSYQIIKPLIFTLIDAGFLLVGAGFLLVGTKFLLIDDSFLLVGAGFLLVGAKFLLIDDSFLLIDAGFPLVGAGLPNFDVSY